VQSWYQTVSEAMATGGEARQKGVEELELEVTCPVCQDRFQEPKILPCLHYYCKGCIEALAKRAGGPNQPFPCPECRTPTLLPQGDPDQLQTAFFVNRMKEVHAKLEKVQGKVEAKCEMCSGGVATAFCRQCAEFICEECKKSHERMKVFAGHKVSTLTELKEGGAKEIVAAKSIPPPMCKVHEEQAKIYCYDCRILICRDCVIDEDHKSHDYEFVKKAAPKIQKKLKEHLAPITESQKGVQDAIKNVEGAKGEVVAMDESMTTSIKRSFKELRDILDKREKELLAETAATVEKKMNNLTLQQKKLEMSSGTIQSLVEFVERSVENATDEELMTIHTQMMTRISEETEKQRLNNLELDPVEEADREVTIDCASELKKLCQQNAKMVVAPVNVAMENIDASVDEISKIEMSLTFQNGRPALKMQNIKVVLTSKVDGSRVPTKIARKQRNTYQIEFTPTVRGRHQLEVMYNDKPLLREPVQVFVKIPPTMLGQPVRRIDIEDKVKFVAFNSSEEMLVTAGDKVIIFDKNGKKLHSFTNKKLSGTTGVAADGPNVYVIDLKNSALLKFNNTGKLLKSVGQEGSGEGEFNTPMGLTVVGDEVIVCDCDNHRLQVFTSDLVFVRQIGSQGKGNGQFVFPCCVTHKDGNLYVSDVGNNCVQIFNVQGKFLRTLIPPGRIDKPFGIVCSRNLVYITQGIDNGKVHVYHKNGSEVYSIPCNIVCGIAVDLDGFVYISDSERCQVVVF
jgi:DNA-binding beta-propeller fold protein YncE